MDELVVAFDRCLPSARWGAVFHVLRLERPDLRIDWRPVGFPRPDRPLLDGADVGLYPEPPPRADVRTLTIETSPMVVTMAVGHRLAGHTELRVADVLDEPFPGAAHLDPDWVAFWTLEQWRGGPPRWSDDAIDDAEQALEVVVAGRAIVTLPASVAAGLSHPGVISLPLTDGPAVRTQLVWHAGDRSPLMATLVELARAMTSVSCNGAGTVSCDGVGSLPAPRGPRRRRGASR
jgi:DNA-binding transcriptional LysR family regulator